MLLDPKKIRKVFVRAPNWLGDVIMATPSFARIRSQYIHAEIVCGMKRGQQPILSGCKSFDRYLPMKEYKGFRGFRKEVQLLRKERFDLAILFPNSLSTALRVVLAGVRYRLGYSQGRGFLLTHGIRARQPLAKIKKRYGPRREPVPMPAYYAAMLDVLDMPKIGTHPILRVSADEVERATTLLENLGIAPREKLILLNPAAAFGSSKLWAAERWAALADGLRASLGKGFRLLVLVGPGEEGIARAIAAHAGQDLLLGIDPLLPLELLKAVVQRASLMVTTDSGPRHIAVAFDCPHVVLMGPTHPGYTALNTVFATVLRHEVDCGPCHLKTCPLDHLCMQLIEVKEVLEACLARLEGTKMQA